MGWTSSRVHIQTSASTAEVAAAFQAVLLAAGARPASIDEQDSGIDRYTVFRPTGSPWVTVGSRHFAEVDVESSAALSAQVDGLGLRVSVFDSDVALIDLLGAAAGLSTVQLPCRRQQRAGAAQVLGEALRGSVGQDELHRVLSTRATFVEDPLGELLGFFGLPEEQSFGDLNGPGEAIDVVVRMRDAPQFQPSVAAPQIGGHATFGVFAIEGWPIDQAQSHLSVDNIGGGFGAANLAFRGDGLRLVDVTAVRLTSYEALRPLVASSEATEPFASSMRISLAGGSSVVDPSSQWWLGRPSRLSIAFDGVGKKAGAGKIDIEVHLDDSEPVSISLDVRVATEARVPLPAVRARRIPGGSGQVTGWWLARSLAGLFFLDSDRCNADAIAPALKRWSEMPGVTESDSVDPVNVAGVRRLRRKDIGGSKKWSKVAAAIESTAFFAVQTTGPGYLTIARFELTRPLRSQGFAQLFVRVLLSAGLQESDLQEAMVGPRGLACRTGASCPGVRAL